MRLIKKLNLFMLKTFLPLFAMTFFIVLFIVLMQFLWKYIDDLVGKGLSMDVLGELFFYAAVSMVPMALPLAILLASLMTFGNLGERFELTAMKASGISLIKVMRPLIVLIAFVAVGAFFFQNDVLPKAQVKMWTLLFSMRQKSPELEIPEGVFYDQIPGYNLFVREKDRNTGMLRDVMIYDVSKGTSSSTILLADSAQLAMTKGNKYLYLHLMYGEEFENLREQQMGDQNVPFRRESFYDKQILIPFDANFNRLDEEGMRKQYVGKNITELRHTIDSINHRVDSIGRIFTADLSRAVYKMPGNQTYSAATYYAGNSYEHSTTEAIIDSTGAVARDVAIAPPHRASNNNSLAHTGYKATPLNIDSMLTTLPEASRSRVFNSAQSINIRNKGDIEFRAADIAAEKKSMRRHEIELLKKFTLSVACLIFFFIGAPLGAIIRKGGLGTPLVISVLLFLVYYIIDNTGYKMARDGHAAVWLGMWLSTFILAPLSIYVTIKAMNDSAVFDRDRYVAFFRRIFGISTPRTALYKEVVINDIDPATAYEMLATLRRKAQALLRTYPHILNYFQYWLRGYDAASIAVLGKDIDESVDYIADSRNIKVVDMLSSYPILTDKWVYHPAPRKWAGWIAMLIFPFGIPIYFISLPYQRTLKKQLQTIVQTSERIEEMDI